MQLSAQNPQVRQMQMIEWMRLGFLWTILLVLLSFRALQPQFISTEIIFPLYSILGLAFLLHYIYLQFLDKLPHIKQFTFFLFVFDNFLISSLSYFNGVNQSLFLFLFLVNIIMCGFMFRTKGALVLALLSSISFNVLALLNSEIKGQSLFFSVGLNNIAFYSVAFLSGYLSDQINFLGVELKEKVKDLKALKNLNDLILHNVATGLITIDANSEIVRFNKSAQDIFSDNLTLTKRNIKELLPNYFDQLILQRELQSEGSSWRSDYIYTDLNGEKHIFEIVASILKDDEFAERAYILAIQDLTLVRKLEDGIKQSEKLAAVGQLAAGIAHEIRNPLASISGSIELLKQPGMTSESDQKRLMSIVLKEIDRLNNLITEFLDYVKPNPIYEDKVDLSHLLKDICEMNQLNQNLDSKVQLDLKLESKQLILGSRDKLKQAFLNIIINSYHAVAQKSPGIIQIKTTDVGSMVVVQIIDNGMGIETNRIKKIFEPFHTTKVKGTGLGLAVTHKIIESHRAQIEVLSEKDVGTEFKMSFHSVESLSSLKRNQNDSTSSDLALAQNKNPEENLSWGLQNRK